MIKFLPGKHYEGCRDEIRFEGKFPTSNKEHFLVDTLLFLYLIGAELVKERWI
jgi:hypothetical protein